MSPGLTIIWQIRNNIINNLHCSVIQITCSYRCRENDADAAMAENLEGRAHPRNMKSINRKQQEQCGGVAAHHVCLCGIQVSSHRAKGFGTMDCLALALHLRTGPLVMGYARIDLSRAGLFNT